MKFPIPSSFPDLEQCPYNLLPYPAGFDDDDEASRADSFKNLILYVEQGNQILLNNGIALFSELGLSYEENAWCGEERVQALYTLVRKSSSLAPRTRARLISSICEAIYALCSILSTPTTSNESIEDDVDINQNSNAVSQKFRDAFACHLYMLYSLMFLYESEAKLGKSSSKGKKKATSSKEVIDVNAHRAECAEVMLTAAQTMCQYQSKLWKRGVPEESVHNLPCRISILMLENSDGVNAQKAASANLAIGIIAATVDSATNLSTNIVAALVDLLHSYEHMALLAVDLCCKVNETPVNRLAIELLRELGRLSQTYDSDDTGRGNGVKNVAPFVSELAAKRPQLVLSNISLVMPLLQSEHYQFRNSIVTTIGNILVNFNEHVTSIENKDDKENSENNEGIDLSRGLYMQNNRDSLLDILVERTYDKNSFVRSTVMKTWKFLIGKKCLPLDKVTDVTSLAIDRLQDKTVLVRRGAMQLLTLILERNPFYESLNPLPYQEKIVELRQFLKSNLPTSLRDAVSQNSDPDTEIEELEEAALIAVMKEEVFENEADLNDSEREYLSKVRALKFAFSAVNFIKLFENTNGIFESMLSSTTVSDVTEALRFFVRAHHFELPFAITGIKRALILMWSNEKNIKDEVIRAFIDIFIREGTDGCKQLNDDEIAREFLFLVRHASVSELASIEEVIKVLVQKNEIPSEVFLILWSTTQGPMRATAFSILSMGAAADSKIVDSLSRLRIMLEAGFGDYVEENRDWKTIASAACALSKIGKSQASPGSAKSLVLEMMLDRLCTIVRGDWCQDTVVEDTKGWFSAAEKSINAIFVIFQEPEKICANIIYGLEATTFCVGTENSSSCSDLRLSRFCFVVGHIALKLLVYTEELCGTLRRAQAAKTIAKQTEASSSKKKDGDKEENDDAIEKELGVAAEAEAENEQKLAEITENEIVGRGLISVFAPIIVHIVADEDFHCSSDILMQSATLALCKFMCISETFCENHLSLLFMILGKASSVNDITMRSNIVISLGDLAFRFPNAVEPYTPHIYLCLRDKFTSVRKNTLMVLMHLILNDMVKVKGQVCEIALCLEDQEPAIRDMSRLLFQELSKRSNNPIYNLLSDIISKLSQMDIEKKTFRNIMLFLLGFIEKEKQNETFIEKLCLRFPTCTSISQKADIAFCLSQLKVTAKCIKCFNDNFKYYKDSLYDEEVFNFFAEIVQKVKKTLNNPGVKPEMEDALEEWEKKLSNENASGMENHIAGNKAEKAKAKAAKRASRRKRNKALSELHSVQCSA